MTESKPTFPSAKIVAEIQSQGPLEDDCWIFLYDAYRRPIVASLRYYIPDRGIRNDIYTESVLDLIEAIKQHKFVLAKGGSIRNYLWSIYRNKVFAWMRKGSIEGTMREGEETRGLPSAIEEDQLQEELFSRSALLELEKEFRQLPTPCQEALELRYGIFGSPQKSLAEIADLTGKTAKNASNYISRCRGHLFRRLIRSKEAHIQEYVIRELENPHKIMLLESYWEKAGEIIRYLDHEMTEAEEEAYEADRDQDPELDYFESCIKKWGRTRIDNEETHSSLELTPNRSTDIHITFKTIDRQAATRHLLNLIRQS
ncbi:MAG: sigma-70 family RNA polymerase sigma factor [Bacteroidota bacterium]